MSTVIPLHRRSAGINLLELLDTELRSLTRIIVSCERLRRRNLRPGDLTEALLGHHERLQSIQELALELHERNSSH